MFFSEKFNFRNLVATFKLESVVQHQVVSFYLVSAMHDFVRDEHNIFIENMDLTIIFMLFHEDYRYQKKVPDLINCGWLWCKI